MINGNTPTGVGKTGEQGDTYYGSRKHPHGRGEDPISLVVIVIGLETPPRAWGRRVLRDKAGADRGNTPTGVGKTGEGERGTGKQEKHPHGRGEDSKRQSGPVIS